MSQMLYLSVNISLQLLIVVYVLMYYFSLFQVMEILGKCNHFFYLYVVVNSPLNLMSLGCFFSLGLSLYSKFPFMACHIVCLEHIFKV